LGYIALGRIFNLRVALYGPIWAYWLHLGAAFIYGCIRVLQLILIIYPENALGSHALQ